MRHQNPGTWRSLLSAFGDGHGHAQESKMKFWEEGIELEFWILYETLAENKAKKKKKGSSGKDNIYYESYNIVIAYIMLPRTVLRTPSKV